MRRSIFVHGYGCAEMRRRSLGYINDMPKRQSKLIQRSQIKIYVGCLLRQMSNPFNWKHKYARMFCQFFMDSISMCWHSAHTWVGTVQNGIAARIIVCYCLAYFECWYGSANLWIISHRITECQSAKTQIWTEFQIWLNIVPIGLYEWRAHFEKNTNLKMYFKLIFSPISNCKKEKFAFVPPYLDLRLYIETEEKRKWKKNTFYLFIIYEMFKYC